MPLNQARKIDSALGVLTPEGIEFMLCPAGLPVRACAFAIDQLVQWGFLIVISVALQSRLGRIMGIWLFLILIFAINWFYHVFCELVFKGQSLGKRILGIRVVRSDGSPVNPGASFLRNLLRFADTFMFLYLIALVCMVFSQGFRRIGDWAADTLVVYTPHALAPLRRPVIIQPDTAPVLPSRPLSYEEKQAILMFARRYPLLGEARAGEIAHAYAASLREEGHIQETGPAAEKGDSAYLLGIAYILNGGGKDI